MKRILSLTLSLLMVFSVLPFTMMSASADAVVYQTIVDMSDYDGATLKEYASPWYTEGLTRSYNIANTGYSYDAELDALKITRGTYDPCGLYYFDKENLPLAFSDSLGFRVWVKGDEASGVNVTDTKNLYFIFNTLDGDTHTSYVAGSWDGSSYGFATTGEGAWAEFYWEDLAKKFRQNTEYAFISDANGKGGNRPTISAGTNPIVAPSEWLDKVDGFVIGFKQTGANKIYYVGDVQLIKPAVTVEVDGQNITSYSGEKITLPAPATDGVIGYTDGKNLYYPGDEYTVPGNIALTNITTVVDADSDHDFVFDTSDKTYTGQAICPQVTSATLTQGVDYTVEYKNNVSAGTGEIYVRGTGNCFIDLVETFNIESKAFEASDFMLEDAEFIYSGEEIKPEVYSNVFTAQDYQVTYENNIDAGEGTATAIITSTYLNGSGSVRIPFSISQKEITEDMFNFDLSNKTYTGVEITPAVTSENLVFNADYMVGYSWAIDVGTATITVEGMGNYTGTITKTFDIVAKEIEESMFTVDTESKVYTAKEICPEITSTLGENDYEVSYSNNVDTGVATITITGTGNYAGTLEYNFTILQKEIDQADFSIDLADKDYTGQKICPSVSSDVLQDKDFVVSYENNIDTGTATITITGMGNCSGQIVKTFTINKKTLSAGDFTIDLSDKEYANKEIKPEITSTLAQDVDYTVVYTNNVGVGTATITITACGENCQGEVVLDFNIVKHELEVGDFIVESLQYIYSGEEFTPAVASSFKDSDYELEYNNNINAGQAYITITGKDNCTGSVDIYFTIEKREIENDWFSLAQESVTFTGEGIEVEVVSELIKNTNYKVTYSNNVNHGTATVTVIGIGNYKGTEQYTFFIGRKSLEEDYFIVDTDSKVFVNGEICPPVASELIKDTDYSVVYSNNTNVGTAEIVISGEGNYDGQVVYSFEITPDMLTPDKFSVDTTASYVYDGKAKELPFVSLLIADVDYTVAYENNVNAGTATLVLTGIGNYAGEVRVDYTIAPATITKSNFSVSTAKMYYTGKALKKNIKSKLGILTTNDFSVSYKNNTRVGTATITITGKKNFKGTLKYTFKIVKPTVKRTSKLTLVKGSKKITVKYKKVSKADGYVIQYSLKKNFKGKKTVYVSKKYAKKVLKKLKSGKKYYVRVAAYRKYKKTGSSKTYKAIGKYRTKTVKVK